MKPMDSRKIRQKFLDYFARNQHRVVRSSSLVPANDPTLYFTNAGMVQFKDVFIGQETRDYTRACSSQKCLRVSGKHNDLESVGRTHRHHTFFEMLGNFSFGDYFKREAIHFGWECLTKEMGLDPERMVATVFRGEQGVPADEEAFEIWRKEIGLPEERILRLGKEDNFWAMGDVGPCGPCSEIHYFQGNHLPCQAKVCAGVACDCERWVEIWNLVFMQFFRDAAGQLTPLKAKGVDTGMGLERLTAVIQGVTSTYETDLLRPIIDFVAELAGRPYGTDPERDISLRVIADHSRATAFCIADGVFPEKGGREYVLRRIMRRAIRHGKRIGFEEPFFHRVCEKVVEMMGEVYPELREHAKVIDTIVQAEETSFRRTLNRGLQKLQEAIGQAQTANAQELPEAFVGDLYATDGFPIDLTRLIAEEAGLRVDEAKAYQWVTQTHGATDTRVGEEAVAVIYKQLLEKHGPTQFRGYDLIEAQSQILALLGGDHYPVDAVTEGQSIEVVTMATPFYGRSGGQVGDTGWIEGPRGLIEITDTLKPGGQIIVHQGKVLRGTFRQGETVTLKVDSVHRQNIRLNHSATHLLHHALRKVLGLHVAQKGSEVSPEYLRFDFSHFEAVTAEQLRQVEELVNAEIRANVESRTDIKTYEEAQQTGAMALFGEKYGDVVRVVHIGNHSQELCGGTHVQRTGEIGLCKIISEEALAMGVRRIVAVTGAAALNQVQQTEVQLRAVANLLRCGMDQAVGRVDKLLGQMKEQDKKIEELQRKLALGGGEDLLGNVREVKGIRVLISRVDDADPKILRQAGDTLRDRLGSGLVVLGGAHQGKANLLVMVSKDLHERYHAGKIVAQLAQALEGKGGGRPDMAQGGGPRLDRLDATLQMIYEMI